MANVDSFTPGRVVGGKYRLVRPLAAGGMGTVWVARHELLGSDVAVKLMGEPTSAIAFKRFEREAKASAQLKSRHIVRVHDYGLDGDTPFMVMELLEGEDLGARLARTSPMTLAELVPIVQQIARALAVAHDAGIVHRDLKPSNVFLAREAGEQVVKLVDFGVARETKTSLVDEQTTSGVVVGTPHHMSPEQARGEHVDHRTDLWSLGVLVFRALTGTKPFEGNALAAILLAVMLHPIPKATSLNPALPADVDRFLEKALSRYRARRFQSARAMADALAAIADGSDVAPFLLAEAEGEDDAQASQPSEGRDDATLDSPSPVLRGDAEQAARTEEPPLEKSGSREVAAVTSGVRKPPRKTGPWLWVALGVILLGGAFYLGRMAGGEVPEGEAAAEPIASADVTSEASVQVPPRDIAPEPPPAPPPAPSASALPEAPLPSGAAKVAPPPQPTAAEEEDVDPLTGLRSRRQR
jgi:eukaryotic-like serine/threonine-protein kinase